VTLAEDNELDEYEPVPGPDELARSPLAMKSSSGSLCSAVGDKQ
jgi:hypothetical protein